MNNITEMLIPPAFSVKFDFHPANRRMDSTKIKNNNKIISATKVPTGKGRTEMFCLSKSRKIFLFIKMINIKGELTNEFVDQ